MQTQSITDGDAQYILRKLLFLGGAEFADSHQWLSEADRWKEMVFALLTCCTKLPQQDVRLLSDELFQLDLLQISSLAGIITKPSASHAVHPHSRRFIQTLQEGGFSKQEAARGLSVICQAASALAKGYSGKIQFYLRSYAEKILGDARSVFRFSELSDEEVRYAITLWLQNVCSMPVSLQDEAVQAFGKANRIAMKDFFASADEMDVNVAWVDDLIRHFQSNSKLNEADPVDSDRTRRAAPARKTQKDSSEK
jgi:hypothetical protein